MHEYHVGFPDGMMLTVEIENTPIKMHITFPSGKELTFDYVGNVPGPPRPVRPHRTATVTPSTRPVAPPPPIPATFPRNPPAANAALGPLRKVTHVDTSTGLQVEYVDPGGSEM